MTCSEKSVLSHPWDTGELQGDFIYSYAFNTRREKGVSPPNGDRHFCFLASSESQEERNTLIIVSTGSTVWRVGTEEKSGRWREGVACQPRDHRRGCVVCPEALIEPAP